MSGERGPGVEPDPGASTVLVDGHVHLHPRFDEGRFFEAALVNFTQAAGALEVEAPWERVLVFTEIAGTDRFSRLLAAPRGVVGGGWRVEPTSEDTSLRLRWDREQAVITVVAGRQVQTKEGLEVLAFPHRGPLPDGRPIHDAILQAADVGALAVVPWGFGKWSGTRGRRIRALLANESSLPFLLADTGHRPAWASRPSSLAESERLGRPTLTGSDPLPLEGQERRPGSCCFLLAVHSFTDQPALRLKEAISALDQSPPRYERRVGTRRFATAQLAMQIKKRRR